jgi:hypothetical protein
MSTDTLRSRWGDRLRPGTETVLIAAMVLNAELLLLGLYWLVGDTTLTSIWSLQYWLYPMVWINVGLLAIVKTTPRAADARDRWLATGLAVGYFGILAYAGGLVGPAAGIGESSLRLSILGLPPGWGPALLYSGERIAVALMPFKLIGYTALAYLVYATVLDAAGSAVSGVLGLLSCVSCSWPVLASLATGVLGSGSAVATAVYSQSYALSTVVFVVTVGLLYWRPFGR